MDPFIQSEHAGWFCFQDQVAVIRTHDPTEVMAACRQVESAVERQGLHAAGFVSYEAAPAFDRALTVREAGPLPLVWFGLYRKREIIAELPAAPASHRAGAWTPSVSRQEFDRAIGHVRDAIARGETYQVNYTFRLRAPFEGDAWSFAAALFEAQDPRFGAWLDIGSHAICSASPELFFSLRGNRLVSRPMKGTAPRAPAPGDDDAQAAWLQRSGKNRAENVMIVDMIRNDMGRIAETGTVKVESLYDVERHAPAWQMTSTVSCATQAGFADILAAMFPCASVTGAPKASTMRIIAGLETAPRGLYTGCTGYLSPGREAHFNVAIRTAVVDRARGQAEFGVGGGIVWDSTPDDEYRECCIKAGILTQRRPRFALLETMLWQPRDGYFLLSRHMKRLAGAAAYFGFACDAAAVAARLEAFAATLPAGAHRVRLLVDRRGGIEVESGALDLTRADEPVRLALAAEPVDSSDPFLYHKTTQRDVYDRALAAHPGCGDVLLWNERGELTETCTANVVCEIDGRLVTPPASSGLLAGTFRQWLIETGEVSEQVIKKDDLRDVARIWIVNSVRCWREAVVPR